MLLRRLAALASLGLFSAGLAHAQDVTVGDPACGYAAVQAVASWRFDPPEMHGRTVTTHVEVPFDFAVK